MRNTGNYTGLLMKGLAMGATDIIPGVSGGTIAFISGIYEELISSIRSIDLTALKLLFSFKLKEFWKHINGNFLITVATGILIGIFSLSHLIEYLLLYHPENIWSFFFGLIFASAVFIFKNYLKAKWQLILSLILGIVLAYWITSISPAETSNAYWFIFISGVIAICAMILPGISGSFILLLLGKYQFILNAVNELKIDILAVFILGALIGIISFSNLLSWLLKRFHDVTIILLAGFMLGSLNKIWPWKEVTATYTDKYGHIKPLTEINVFPESLNSFLMALIFAVLGIAVVIVIEYISKSLKK